MNPERWQQIEAIYHAAVEREPTTRAAYLAQACGSDTDLRREVQSLLERDPSSPENPLNQPAWQPAMVSVGTRLGPYEILASIGAGGMGTVWKARDTRLGRTVALKISRTPFSQRFEREVHAVAALNHPHICTLYDVGPNYFVMEYIDGKSLRETIARKGIPLVQTLHYAAQIADALAAAHAAGIVHRDLKPGNVMVTADDRVKVVDFGLARVTAPLSAGPDDPTFTATREGIIAGTVSYMSPEQAQGRAVDARSDIFSFGAVLYEMLTGARAFQGDSAISTLADIINKEPRPAVEISPNLPHDVETLLTRCLRKDPARRWQNMADLKVALLDLKDDSASGRQVRAPAPRKFLKGGAARIATGFLLAIAGIAVGAIWDRLHAPAAEVWSGTLLGGPIIASHPRISPDGQLLAFRAIVGNESQVAVMKPDAASWTVLTQDESQGAVSSVAWAHDGSKIYFDRQGTKSVYSIAPLGGEPRLVMENAEKPEALSDGSLIVLRPSPDGRRQLLQFWPDSGRVEPLPASVMATDTRSVSPFPDAKEVAVFGYYGAPSGSQHLFVLELASRHSRDLPGPEDPSADGAVGGGSSRHPATVAVTSDGKSVLTLLRHGDTMMLAAVPRDGSSPGKVLTSFPVAAAPLAFDAAPDGSIYLDQSSFDASVLTIGPSGKVSNEIRVPRDAYGFLPLPGGRYVFTTLHGDRSQLMIALPATGSRPLFNTTEDVRFPCAWMGNGKLAFIIGRGGQTRIAIGTVEDGRILQRLPLNAETVTAVAGSPDGQTVYYASGGAIWAQPVSGGPTRKIAEGSDVTTDPSGEQLYIMRTGVNGFELWRLPAQGGDGQRLSIEPSYRLMGRISPMAVNADGRIIVTVNVPTVFFYQQAILDAAHHTINLLPAPSQAVIANAGWTDGGAIRLVANRWSSTLWHYRALR
jgi:eukaryotic-like serine/threonine-protein kinase